LYDIAYLEVIMGKIIEQVDVIAEFKSDGSIIPMRFRIVNDEGEYEQFSIRAYKQIDRIGTYTTEEGVYVCKDDMIFQCKIVRFDEEKMVKLFFFPRSCSWELAFS
jgi:hypothetical protein